MGKLEMWPANASIEAVCLSIFQHMSRRRASRQITCFYTALGGGGGGAGNDKTILIPLSSWAKKFFFILFGDLNYF